MATLIVVLVLFFVVSLVAAYTNRNLIFEQRTASNQFRSTQAFQAAEAGVEWAISMLNQGRITDTCGPSTDTADQSFRQRYLAVDGTGRITPRDDGSGGPISSACVFNGTGWDCSCPTTSDATVAPVAGAGLFPAFRVRFIRVYNAAFTSAPGAPRQPGVVQIQVVGCTRADGAGEQCLQFDGQGALTEGRAVIDQLVAITGGPSSPPVAALTVRGNVDVGGGTGFSAYNNLPGGSGITVHAGGSISGDFDKIVSQPGTPGGSASFVTDPANVGLNSLTAGTAAVATNAITAVDRMFAAVFNMRPTTFQQQPAAIIITCGVAACPVSDIRTKASLNPGRPIWVDGDLDVSTSGDVGSANDPVVLVVNGDIGFSVSGVTIHGLVYVRVKTASSEWDTSGSGQINGATVCDKDVDGNGTPVFVYDPAVLTWLRWNSGSFVRVPSTWRDWKDPAS